MKKPSKNLGKQSKISNKCFVSGGYKDSFGDGRKSLGASAPKAVTCQHYMQ